MLQYMCMYWKFENNIVLIFQYKPMFEGGSSKAINECIQQLPLTVLLHFITLPTDYQGCKSEVLDGNRTAVVRCITVALLTMHVKQLHAVNLHCKPPEKLQHISVLQQERFNKIKT